MLINRANELKYFVGLYCLILYMKSYTRYIIKRKWKKRIYSYNDSRKQCCWPTDCC